MTFKGYSNSSVKILFPKNTDIPPERPLIFKFSVFVAARAGKKTINGGRLLAIWAIFALHSSAA